MSTTSSETVHEGAESCIACYGTGVCAICYGQTFLAQPEPSPARPCASCAATGVCRYCSHE